MIVATAAYMIPVADKDIQLTVDHAEEDEKTFWKDLYCWSMCQTFRRSRTIFKR